MNTAYTPSSTNSKMVVRLHGQKNPNISAASTSGCLSEPGKLVQPKTSSVTRTNSLRTSSPGHRGDLRANTDILPTLPEEPPHLSDQNLDGRHLIGQSGIFATTEWHWSSRSNSISRASSEFYLRTKPAVLGGARVCTDDGRWTSETVRSFR